MKTAFHKRLFVTSPAKGSAPPVAQLTEPQRRIRAAVRRNPGVAALVTTMGNAVDGVKESLRAASLRNESAVRALVMTAMKDVLLRGVASTHLREMVTAALATIAPQFTEPGFSLAKGVGAVLSRIEAPLGQLLWDAIPNPQIRQVLLRALAALVRNAGTEREATRLGRGADGVLGRLGSDLIDRVRPELVALLIGEHENRHLREIVVREVDAVARTVRQEGFGSLLRFGEIFRRTLSRTTKALARLLLEQLDESGRPALADGLESLASQVAADLLAERAAGKNLLTVIAENASRRIAARAANRAAH